MVPISFQECYWDFLGRPILRDFFRIVVLFTLILVTGTEVLHSAQKGSEKSTRVTLGNVSGPAKGKVMVPLYLTPASEELRLGSISAAIGFDSKMVSFVRAESGFLLEAADGTFHAEVKKGAESSTHSVLLLEIATKGEPQKPIKEGLVLTVAFQIAPDAAVGSKVNLDFEKLSAGDLSTPPKVIEPLSGQKGIIEILLPETLPYVACFFFSH